MESEKKTEQKKPTKRQYRKKDQSAQQDRNESVVSVSENSTNDTSLTIEEKVQPINSEKKVETKKRKQISIVSLGVHFYRCNMKFTREPTILFVDELSNEVLERLKDEKRLVVTEV